MKTLPGIWKDTHYEYRFPYDYACAYFNKHCISHSLPNPFQPFNISNVGENDGPIWLSILGEVFDVTEGRTYYEKGSSYDYFAGTDATVSFFTGDFTEEGRKKSILDLKPKEMESIEQWISFYKDHETYTFLGLLDGEFYNADGAPTSLLNQVRQIVKDVKMAKSEL